MPPADRVVAWPTLGFLVADWIEAHCVVPDGDDRGAPLTLVGWQLWDTVCHYRVRPEATPGQRAPAFHFRRTQVVRPQKAGKAPWTAALVCVEGVGPALLAGWAEGGEVYRCRDHGCMCGWEYHYEPGEPMGRRWPTPLIQITATSEDQADNIYDALRPMIDEGPLAAVIPKTGEEFIRLPGQGRIDVVTSNATSRLGQRVTFCPQDETGLWTATNKMIKVAETQRRGLAGMGGRAVETTNAWDPSVDSVAKRTFDAGVVDIHRDFPQPPKNLSYTNKRERRKIHAYVYEDVPWVDLDAIEPEAVELLEVDPAQAMRFLGNMLVAGSRRAVDPAVWDARARPDLEVPPGTPMGIGFDGSETDDHTALVGTVWGTNHQVMLGVWDPRAYDDDSWRLEVHQRVREVMTTFRVGLMLCDPAKWRSDIAMWQREYGDDVVLAYPQSDQRMGPATEAWLEGISNDQVSHDGDPTFRAHVVAAQQKSTEHKVQGRFYPLLTKGADLRKIDLAVTAVMSLEAAARMDQPTEEVEPWAAFV